MRSRIRSHIPFRALVLGSTCYFLVLSETGYADSDTADIQQLRASLKQEMAELRHEQQKLNAEFLRLDAKSKLLDRQLKTLRATGSGSAGVTPSMAAAPSPTISASSAPAAEAEIAQASTGTAAPTANSGQTPASQPAPESSSAPIQGPSAQDQQARRVLETAPTLSNTGGVLTPKGQIVIDPSMEYDYWSQNQLGVNGFQIIPGITFGNIFVHLVEQNIVMPSVTIRAGITDRLEVNIKIPYVYNNGTTTSLVPEGASAQILTASAQNSAIGDIQFGASYQINSGQNGWPILVGNFLFKTATGVSPFDVPIITVDDANGQFLEGIPKKLATGTGFYSAEPSLTVLYPTAPGVLFANLLYINNLGRTVNIQNTGGGPPSSANVKPGQALALTFGIGFALNDRTSLTLSYQQEHVFTAHENGQPIAGSAYSFGTFNFGLGYEISRSTRVNVSVGIGAGQNAPVAKVLVEIPYRFSL